MKNGHGEFEPICRAILNIQEHKLTAFQIPLHHVERHVPPADSVFEKGMLGREIGQSPSEWRYDAMILSRGKLRAIREYQLHMLGEFTSINPWPVPIDPVPLRLESRLRTACESSN